MNYISAGHCRHQHSAGLCSKGHRDSVLCWRIRQDLGGPPPLLVVCHLGGGHEVVRGLPLRSDKCLRILTNFPDHWPQVSLTVSILRILNRKNNCAATWKPCLTKPQCGFVLRPHSSSFSRYYLKIFRYWGMIFYHGNRLGQAKTQLSKTS